MARMSNDDARNLCAQFGLFRHPELPEWHRMDSGQKERVLSAADCWKYRKPRNSNESRGRYFATYLAQALESE